MTEGVWQDEGGTHQPYPQGTGRVGKGTVVVAVLAVLAFTGFATAGALVVGRQTQRYSSTALLAIDQPLLVAGSRDAGPVEKLSRLRLQYAGLMRTDTVAVPVGEEVGLASAVVASRLSATAVPNSLLIAVTASGPTAEAARRLAGAAAVQLVSYAQLSQDRYSIPSGQQIVLTVVSEARDGAAVRRSDRTVATVAAFLGLVGAALVLAIASLVRRRDR